MNSLEFFYEFTRLPQWIHLDSSMNSLDFINNSSTNCFEWVHLNSSMISFEFINKYIWIYPQIQLNLSADSFKIFTNFLKISLIFIIWIFWENHQWIHKWIHKWIHQIMSLTEKFFNSFFLVFSHFAKLFVKFFKP